MGCSHASVERTWGATLLRSSQQQRLVESDAFLVLSAKGMEALA